MSEASPIMAELTALGPRRAAAFWLERLQSEPEAEDGAFHVWLSASDAHQEAWDEALELWDCFDEPIEDAGLMEMRRAALALRPRRAASSWVRYAAAASVVAVISVGVALTGLRQHAGERSGQQAAVTDGPNLAAFGTPDFATKVGERRSVKLEDGSTLTLDSASAVDVAFAEGKRMVRVVRGQVFFDVVHMADRPFRVASGARIISVLGTRFDVRLEPNQMTVYLERGSISVSKGSDPAHPSKSFARLSPGEQLFVRIGQSDQVRAIAQPEGSGRRQGLLQFDNIGLDQAVAEMNRHASKQIVIRDPKIAALRISGAFPTGDIDRFVQTLVELYPVRAVRMPDGHIEIAGRR